MSEPTTAAGRRLLSELWGVYAPDVKTDEPIAVRILAIEQEAARQQYDADREHQVRLVAEAAAVVRADLTARIIAAVEDGTLGLSTDAHHLVRAVPDGVACVCGQYNDADHGIEASELWRSHLIAAARAAVLTAIREASDA